MIDLTGKVFEDIKNSKVVAFDIETSGLSPFTDSMIGFSLAYKNSGEIVGVYVPLIRHGGNQCAIWDDIKLLLYDFLHSKTIKLVFNAKFENSFMYKYFREYFNFYDVMLDVYLATNRTFGKGIGLKDCAVDFLGEEPTKFEALLEQYSANSLVAVPDLERVAEYGILDSVMTLKLYDKFHEEVVNKYSFLSKVEQGIVPLITEVEREGLCLDPGEIMTNKNYLETELYHLEKEILSQMSNVTGESISINLGSTKQLADVLFGKMKLQSDVKSEKTGALSTSADALHTLRELHPIINLLLIWKEMKKFLSSFGENLLDYVQQDGKIHTSYIQVGVKSGRFSSKSPNMQNIAKGKVWKYKIGEEEKIVEANIRKAFKPPKGYFFMEFDYSQVEALIIAAESKEEVLLKVMNDPDGDIHINTALLTAPAVLGRKITPDEVTKEFRSLNKTVNYCLLFGGSSWKLAGVLNIKSSEARKITNAFFKGMPALQKYFEFQKSFGRKWGFVITHFGRKMFVESLNSDDPKIVGHAERECVNLAIQGTAADILKIALFRISKMLNKYYTNGLVKMVLTTHDSVTFVVSYELDSVVEFYDRVKTAMTFDISGYPKLSTSVELGEDYGSLKEFIRKELSIFDKTRELRVVKTNDVKHLIIEVYEASKDGFKALRTLLEQNKGDNIVSIFYKGKEIQLPFRTSLCAINEATIKTFIEGKVYEKESI